MSAYLEAHLPHLTSLHTQLALGTDALASDQARIEAAIKTAVEELLRERETQVDEYKEVIAAQKRRMSNLARALGDKGRNVVDVHRRESMENETLPKQLDRLIKQSEDLENVSSIGCQQTILTHLAALLGPPIEPPKPLARLPAARSSLVPAPTSLGRVVSGTYAGTSPSTSASGAGKLLGPGADAGDHGENEKEALYDVAEHITVELDGKVQVALQERESRVTEMIDAFDTLRSLHFELALPPVPMTQPHHFPIHLLPTRASEETPGANAAHEKLLSRVLAEMATIRSTNRNLADDDELPPLEALKGVEPELGLLGWLGNVRELWEQEQSSREARIQQLYDQIEPLWGRLQLDQNQMSLFTEMNCGCSEAAIKAYEIELERCLELRRSSLSSFILGARAEIEQLWADLMLSDQETSAFGAFIDGPEPDAADQYTEELLAEHEAYAEELRAEITSKAALLPRVREWHALVVEEEELERLQNDPDRFKRRGGAMLKEERSRKRVMNLKPKIEAEMLDMIPAWEEANGRPFVVQGERVVDKIHEALEAKEAAKEAKKRARQGLGPPSTTATSTTSRALQPARTVRGTPAPAARGMPPSATSTSMMRKREAPTPTPSSFGNQAKKGRMAPPPSTARSISASAAGGGTSRLGMGTGARAASATAVHSGIGMGMGTRIMQAPVHDISTPCPPSRPVNGAYATHAAPPVPVYQYTGLQSRTASNSSATSVTSSYARQAPSVQPPLHQYSSTTAIPPVPALPPLTHLTSLAKANGRRPAPPKARRESFKPRQSLMRGMSMIRAEAPPFGFDEGDEAEIDGMEGVEVDVRVVSGGHPGVGPGMGMGLVEEEGDVFE